MSEVKNNPACCTAKEDPKKEKSFLKKLWCFFFGCNCH